MEYLLEALKEYCVAARKGERLQERMAKIVEKASALVDLAIRRDKNLTTKVIKLSRSIIAERSYNIAREGLLVVIERKSTKHVLHKLI